MSQHVSCDFLNTDFVCLVSTNMPSIAFFEKNTLRNAKFKFEFCNSLLLLCYMTVVKINEF